VTTRKRSKGCGLRSAYLLVLTKSWLFSPITRDTHARALGLHCLLGKKRQRGLCCGLGAQLRGAGGLRPSLSPDRTQAQNNSASAIRPTQKITSATVAGKSQYGTNQSAARTTTSHSSTTTNATGSALHTLHRRSRLTSFILASDSFMRADRSAALRGAPAPSIRTPFPAWQVVNLCRS